MQHKDTEYFLTRGLIVFGILVFGFFGSKIVGSLYYDSMLDKYNQPLRDVRDYYNTKIDLENDPYTLTKLGRAILKTDNKDVAYKALKKSTEIDGKWRDGWIWRAYAELKLAQPKDALASLKEAEKIDSIYPLTYELLDIAYQATGDETSAKFAKEKAEFLNNKNQ